MSRASKLSSKKLHPKGEAPNFTRFRSSSEQASRHLASIKSSGSKAECLLRSVLWRRGLRFRKNVSTLPGKPDIVFSTERVAVFCDGDFWHGRHWTKNKARLAAGPNAAYWVAKIARNRERDKICQRQLRQTGWCVLRFWESDILDRPMDIADCVTQHLRTFS